MKSFIASVSLLLVLTLPGFAREVPAANAAQLRQAISAAQPGDTIVLADGVWRDAAIDVTTGGSSSAPLLLRAQTPGRVVLTGASRLTLSAPHVVVDGLLFHAGALPEAVNVIQFNSDHGRVTQCAVVDYNPANSETGYYWVYFNGNRNRVDHCIFQGKNHHQPLVGNDHSNSRHNTVEFSHFKDIAHVSSNGREIFRIWGYGGNEELGPDGAFFTVASNLFERAHGEGAEIVSLKSNRNIVRNNTIRGTIGGITNRSGNYNTIEGNFILGDGQRGAYGMRITGRHHTIAHNYIEDCQYGIDLMSGEHFLEDVTGSFQPILRDKTVHGRVPRYHHPRYVTIAYNVFVNNRGPDMTLGSSYKAGWPSAQRFLLPEFNSVAYNLFSRTDDRPAVVLTAPDRAPPLDRFQFGGNSFDGNIVSAGKIEAEEAPAGFTFRKLEFVRGDDGLLRPTDPTLAASVVGSVSGFTGDASPFKLLTADDVGPEWVKHRRRSDDAIFR